MQHGKTSVPSATRAGPLHVVASAAARCSNFQFLIPAFTWLRCLALLAFCASLSLPGADMAFPDSPGPPPTILTTNWGVGAWIGSDRTGDKHSCCLWRAFDIPPGALVVKARLRMTADNGFNAMLDGHEFGRGSDWRWLTEFDLDNRLRPGRHVLTVEAFNDALAAGVLAGLRIELEDGQIIEVASDQSWRIVPEGEKHWQNTKNAPETWTPATVVGAFSSGPWNITPRGVVLVTPPTVVALRFWQTGWFQIGLLALLGMGAVVCLRLLAELTFQSRARGLRRREGGGTAGDIPEGVGAGLRQVVLLGGLVQHDLASSFALVKHAPNRSANLDPARHDPAAHPARHEEIDKLCDKTRALLGSMDEIVWAVNSRRDTIREFAAYSCKYTQSFLANTSIRCRLDVEPNLPDDPFDLPTRRNLFLAVKEALNNAARHSGASQILLRLHP